MEKIKAIDPKIVVSGSADKPYYSIEYYNISDGRWHIGYGSYNLKFVKEWLNDDFETVETDVAPVVRCKDCVLHGHCSTEDVFLFSRLKSENAFCCVGKRKENENG